jgi:hypothetical protein
VFGYQILKAQRQSKHCTVNEREEMREVGSSTHFDAEVTGADVVSEEEVASSGGKTADLEQFQEIILQYGKLAATESTNG